MTENEKFDLTGFTYFFEILGILLVAGLLVWNGNTWISTTGNTTIILPWETKVVTNSLGIAEIAGGVLIVALLIVKGKINERGLAGQDKSGKGKQSSNK